MRTRISRTIRAWTHTHEIQSGMSVLPSTLLCIQIHSFVCVFMYKWCSFYVYPHELGNTLILISHIKLAIHSKFRVE